MANHSAWTSCEKSVHLLSILQQKAPNILHSGPATAVHEDNNGALEGHYGDYQLALAYLSQFRARIQ